MFGGLNAGGFTLLSGTADPSAGSGVVANQPALYMRTTGGVSTLWFKAGAGDTAWEQTASVAGATFTGDVTATRFLASGGAVGTPSFSFSGDPDTGIYAEAADTLSFVAGSARYARVRAASFDVLNTAMLFAQALLSTGAITPTILAADANDYSPTGLSTASHVRASASTTVNITGLATGVAGRLLVISNVGSQNITLVHASVASTEANRFTLPGATNVILGAGQSIWLRYDATDSRWRAILAL